MITPARKQSLDELQEKLNTSFIDREILDQALTHSSYGNELLRDDIQNNERLEFLGDAILKLIISEYLYKNFPECAEGDLTKIRAAVVSDLSLSEISKNLGMGKYFLLGKNEKASGGEMKKSNLANALESTIAAMYLDKGLSCAAEAVI
ncbi:MAG: ribonuclease III domain-containing protein, partial [Candidatus Margulisiibacteriota bacterium]